MDVDEGNSLLKISQRYASVRACISVLMQYVFQFPIETSGSIHSTALIAMAKHVLLDAIVYGISVVVVKAGKEPVHLPWHIYRVGVVRRRGELKRTYKVTHVHTMEDIPGAVVLAGFDAEPSDDGEINSVMAAIKVKTILIARLRDCYIAAERNRSMPTTLLERNAEQAAPRNEASYDFYADADDDAVEHDEHNSFQRDKFSLRRIEHLEQAIDDPMDQGVGRMSQAALDAEGSLAEQQRIANRNQTMASIAPVPAGYKVASHAPVGQAPANVVGSFQFFEQEIYSLLGVPRSFVHQDHSRAKVDEAAMQRQLLMAVHKWQDALTRALMAVLTVTRGGTRRGPKPKVEFQRVPIVGVDELYTAYANGCISFETMQDMTLSKLGLPVGLADRSAPAPERLATWQRAKASRQASEAVDSRARPD
jgi:hypothetical protein